MAKKITIRIDDETAKQIDELSVRTQIPKVRLTKQAYELLFAAYDALRQNYDEDAVNLNLLEFLRSNINRSRES